MAKKKESKETQAADPKPKAKKKMKKRKVAKKVAKAAQPLETVNVYSIKGSKMRSYKLPEVFMQDVRPDLIRRAVNAIQANRRQPYGPNPMSGMRHSVETWGKGRGSARVQRLKTGNTAAESPNNVGGRRAHPPRPEKDLGKKGTSAYVGQTIVINAGYKPGKYKIKVTFKDLVADKEISKSLKFKVK